MAMVTNMAMAMAAHAPTPRNGRSRRQPRRKQAVRVVLAMLAASVGYGAVSFSLAQVIARSDPARAHEMAPYAGRITARLAAALTTPDALPTDRARGERFAHLALEQDPTAVEAVAALGLSRALQGRTIEARRAFGYAERLSRRDATTQLWAIEDAVARGDIAGALRHYDIALRVRPGLGEVLYPVLTAASAEPAIRRHLTRTLAANAPWSDSFVDFASGNGKDPEAVASLFQNLQRAGVNVPQSSWTTVIAALLASPNPVAAWTYYASIRSGAQRTRSRDPGFAANLQAPSALDWVAVNDDGVTSTIGPGVFDFAAPASVSGPLVRQVQLLPAGTYRLQGQSEGIEQSPDALPYWTLTCRDGKELGRVDVPNSGSDKGQFTGLFRVSADCPVQTLTLIARQSQAIAGLSGRITRVELLPVR